VAEPPGEGSLPIRVPACEEAAPPVARFFELQPGGFFRGTSDRPTSDVRLPVVVGGSPQEDARRASPERLEGKIRQAFKDEQGPEAEDEPSEKRESFSAAPLGQGPGRKQNQKDKKAEIRPQEREATCRRAEQNSRSNSTPPPPLRSLPIKPANNNRASPDATGSLAT
jgi:hypothetical protein